ncbi:MAG: exopolysaccharide biosynthesis polyprenyl glycosylphosphotransferase [Kiritimatiellae bacterium]|nr:exopolysaccharide biosynthesis polyprenyl glycosylphosphotransferase [Kiritimatiellia bacterium]MDD5521877.1 exopolysaccharide biosynthesis polyprenyl glycosylphosphotransferase [Kiritimatiellia bacterium]
MFSRSHLQGFAIWIPLIDLIALIISSVIAVIIRIGRQDMPDYVYAHIDGWLIFLISIILANYLAGSYRIQYSFSRFNLVVTWIFSLIFSILVLSVFSYAWLFKVLLGRGILLLSIACYSILSLALKMLAYRTLFTKNFLLCRTVIMGVGPRAQEVRNIIENEFVLPVHKVITFVNITGGERQFDFDNPGVIDGVAVLNCTLETFEEIVRNMRADLVVTAFQDRDKNRTLYSFLRHLRFEGVEVLDAFGVNETYLGKTPLDLVDEEAMTRVAVESRLPVIRRYKRISDMFISILFGLIWVPFGLVIACLIKLIEPHSPVFYVQSRIGQFGHIFKMCKFRTMHEGAENHTGPVWSIKDDPRITRFGRVLRKFRLDEIPQFINVLRGEMSIVGPRPERPELHAELEKRIPFFGERLDVMPGLTGWAQVRYPYGNTVEDAIRKLEYDIYYIKYLSFSLDLQIILRTIGIVFFGMEGKKGI